MIELVGNNEIGYEYQKFAVYDTTHGITVLRNFTNIQEQRELIIQNKEFKVIMREGMPFLRKK